MKPTFLLLLPLAAWSHAAEIRCTGVLGNSGEQGADLIRFAAEPASGMGVTVDPTGSLWDRGGDGRLNRYAVDGRLLASYPLPQGEGPHDKDTITLSGPTLLMKIGKKLYILPIDAAAGTEPTALPIEATRLSPSIQDGWAVAANDKTVFLVNAAGETKQVAVLEEGVSDLEIGPDNGIYVKTGDKMWRVDSFAAAERRGPWAAPGERPQWIADRWFGSAWHGTLRRFGADFLPDPGVVLGGASGSFIGYVEGNHEMNDARGLALLGGNLFAASGTGCVMHLLEWRPAEQRFGIVRRIGSVAACSALGIAQTDRILYNGGYWEWTDGPDTSLRHSVPPPDAPGFAGMAGLENGVVVAPAIRWKKPALYYSSGEGPAGLSDDVALPDGAVACAAIHVKGRQAIFVADPYGKGRILFVSGEGKYEGDGGAAELRTEKPITSLTSMASREGILYAATDGELIAFAPEEGGWSEKWRLDSGGEKPEQKFGKEIHLGGAGDFIWVSDTERHRVLCFTGKTVIAEFGTADSKGDDLGSMDSPSTIAATGKRAVVFDSGNQRILKLELE